MNVIHDEVIDEAAAAFRAALDRHRDTPLRGGGGYWVPGSVEAIVTALLLADWRPPRNCSSAGPAPLSTGPAPPVLPGGVSSTTGEHRDG